MDKELNIEKIHVNKETAINKKYRIFNLEKLTLKQRIVSSLLFIFTFAFMILAWSTLWTIFNDILGTSLIENTILFLSCMAFILYTNDLRFIYGVYSD